MLLATHQLGESANELVQKWGKSGYRAGFPDFYAAEFPVLPMAYDQSRIYSGVIGRHYPNAQTSRYHYLYDPNMYMQPGVPTGAGLGSGSFAVGPTQSGPAPSKWGRYLVTSRRVPSCKTAPQGSRVGRDCFTSEQFTAHGLPADSAEAIGLDWEGLVESPLAWAALGGTLFVGGVIGTFIGVAIGKRRAHAPKLGFARLRR